MAQRDAPPAGVAAPADRRRAWVVFSLVFLASTAAPFNQTKVPPLIPVLREALDLSLVEAGLLMSVFSFTGMLMALPAGVLFRRFGPTRAGVFSVGCTALGSLLGAAAPDGRWLLASRLVEGIGMGMTPVLALATIAAWFPAGQRGLPVGIFSAWIPLGNSLMLLLAPPVYQTLGWRAVWLLGGGITLVLLVLYAALVSLPGRREDYQATERLPWHHGLLNPNAWLLSLAFAAYQGSRVGFLTWAPTYLAVQLGYELAAASQLTSANVLVTIPLTLGVGWLMDLVGSRRKVYSLAFLLLIPGWGLIFQVDPAWILPLIVAAGALSAPIVTAINGAAPETAREPRETGPAVGIVAIGRNAGQVAGPAILAAVLQLGGGWQGVAIALGGMSAVGLVSGWMVKVK